LPIVVAHGEGRAEFENSLAARKARDGHKVVLRYLDHYAEATEDYPLNPNGLALGITRPDQ
jgi:phosphoribosylformylglycinamidine synthase